MASPAGAQVGTVPWRLVSIRWRGIGALGHARQGVFLIYREQDRGLAASVIRRRTALAPVTTSWPSTRAVPPSGPQV